MASSAIGSPDRGSPAGEPGGGALALPPIGLGCSPLDPGGGTRDLAPIVDRALELGYPLLDSAELYGTETLIGRALAFRPGARRRLVLVSKLWSTHHRPPLVRAACERSLRALGTDRIDLYLVHAPRAWRPRDGAPRLLDADAMQAHARGADGHAWMPDDVPLAETWGALEGLREAGLVRAIGVSNFAVDDLRALLDAGARPAVDQVARHPLAPRDPLVAFCRQRGIRVMAHSPLGAPGLLAHPAVADLASRLGRSPAQVVLRWNVEQGVIPLPGTRDEAHLADNLGAVDAGWPAGACAILGLGCRG